MKEASAFDDLRRAFAEFTFTPTNEADLQRQMIGVLIGAGIPPAREVRVRRNVYDLVVKVHDVTVVLELKVAGSAPSVERQAQRYALTDGVDAVAVVTTSNRLARELARPEGETLGGKPFAVIALRGF